MRTRTAAVSAARPARRAAARSCAGRGGSGAARGSRSRSRLLLTDHAEERAGEILLTGALAQLVGRRCDDDRAVAHQQQVVALRRLVHHVAGDEQRRAAARELAELVPELRAQNGVETDGRL